MKEIWVISDTHFNHANILNFVDDKGNKIRPFESLSEMNEKMISRWNDRVKQGDIVYHLGDVTMGSKEDFAKLWPRLNGKKRLIVGNHDDIKYLSSGGFFSKVSMWRVWPEHKLVFTHVPINLSNVGNHKSKYDFNVHGHIHHHKSPTKNHFNVSVEAIDYTPIHIDHIVSLLKVNK